MTKTQKTVAIYALGVFVVLLCYSAAVAKRCADTAGHYHVLWCTPDRP